MFETLPQKFRSYNLPADVRVLLILRKAMDKGLVRTLGDIYTVLRGVVVKDPTMMGPFTKAYYDYFLNIDIQNGERLEDAILRSETFKNWKQKFINELDREVELDDESLINAFLDQVHLTSYDIKEIVSGREIWDKDNPHLKDEEGDPSLEVPHKHLDKMADYSDLSLEELLERMKQIQDQQKSKHSGGSHWIGTGGISPYGHGGAAKGGIRVGGTGGGRMARKVMGNKNYFPVDLDSIINDDNVDAALSSLKGIFEESAEDKLDIQNTIKKGLKRGGIFLPEMENIKDKKLQVLLFIDNGGYSMSPFVRAVQEIFKKMKTRFAHDLETYYFHNTIYDIVYTDARRTKRYKFEKILSKDPNYRVFIIGDASMAPYELTIDSFENYVDMAKHFKRIAWLNPEPTRFWGHTMTINIIKEVINMFPLTPKGIEQAVLKMNSKKNN